ncbi:MAG: hypothetical protein F9K29_07800 [Hyphomicrobiaceae bacterium]|nr:MAG: hypothetical protein F9K29_07800 [Hyphomicrobiaceae bacterium]
MASPSSFAAEAVANPKRFYDRPGQVLLDRRLKRQEKLAILEAWELEARSLAVATEENMSGGEPDMLSEVVQARIALGKDTPPDDGAAAPTKHGVRRQER